MSDVDTLDKKKAPRSSDDLSSMTVDLLKNVNIKTAVFLFLFGVLIFSDVFISNILNKYKGATESGVATTKGTFLQLLVLVVGYTLIDLLVQGGCI